MEARRSEPPARPRRQKRRSIAEFAAVLQSGSVVEALPLRQQAAVIGHSSALGEEGDVRTGGETRASADGQGQDTRYSAMNVSRLRKEPRGSGLENESARTQEDIGLLDRARRLPAQAKAIEGYHAKAVELTNAIVNAALDYAWRLAEVRSPGEFIAVSAIHALGHFELIITHAVAFDVWSLSVTAAPSASDLIPIREIRRAERGMVLGRRSSPYGRRAQ